MLISACTGLQVVKTCFGFLGFCQHAALQRLYSDPAKCPHDVQEEKDLCPIFSEGETLYPWHIADLQNNSGLL